MTEKKKAKEQSWPKTRRETRLLSAIHPYPNNPRTHPPAEIEALAAILKEVGPDQDIVIDGDEDFILKGHGRRSAALLAGLREFPCTIRFGLTEAQKVAMRIQDNSLPLMAGWDAELTRLEIARFDQLGGDVKLLGFGDAQLVQFTTMPGPPNQFPAANEVATSFCCPKCGFRWSGDPMAGAKKKGGGDGVASTKPARNKKN